MSGTRKAPPSKEEETVRDSLGRRPSTESNRQECHPQQRKRGVETQACEERRSGSTLRVKGSCPHENRRVLETARSLFFMLHRADAGFTPTILDRGAVDPSRQQRGPTDAMNQ